MRLQRLLRAAAAAALVLASTAARAQTPAPVSASLAGHWDGAIEIPGTKLGVDIDFKSRSLHSEPESKYRRSKCPPRRGNGKGGDRQVITPVALADLHASRMVMDGLPRNFRRPARR